MTKNILIWILIEYTSLIEMYTISHVFSQCISFSSCCGKLFHIIKTFVCSVWLLNTSQAIWYHLWPIFVYLFAVSPGGRGINGNPVIIFPEFPAFGELQDDEIKNVLDYLTSVPRYLHLSIKKQTNTKTKNEKRSKMDQAKHENLKTVVSIAQPVKGEPGKFSL